MTESNSETKIQDFINYLDPEFLGSTPIYRGDLFNRPADQIKMHDFISAKPREDIEKDIEGCESVYDRVNIANKEQKDTEVPRVNRRIYKLDFSSKQSNNSILTACFTLLTVAFTYLIKSIL